MTGELIEPLLIIVPQHTIFICLATRNLHKPTFLHFANTVGIGVDKDTEALEDAKSSSKSAEMLAVIL